MEQLVIHTLSKTHGFFFRRKSLEYQVRFREATNSKTRGLQVRHVSLPKNFAEMKNFEINSAFGSRCTMRVGGCKTKRTGGGW